MMYASEDAAHQDADRIRDLFPNCEVDVRHYVSYGGLTPRKKYYITFQYPPHHTLFFNSYDQFVAWLENTQALIVDYLARTCSLTK